MNFRNGKKLDMILRADQAFELKKVIMESKVPTWMCDDGFGPMFYTGDIITVEFEVVSVKSSIVSVN